MSGRMVTFTLDGHLYGVEVVAPQDSDVWKALASGRYFFVSCCL